MVRHGGHQVCSQAAVSQFPVSIIDFLRSYDQICAGSAQAFLKHLETSQNISKHLETS